MRRLLVFAAIWLIAAVPAQSGVAGKWTGEEQSARAVPVVLQLTVNSSTVTGSVIAGENPAQEVPISWAGEVQDNELRFIRTLRAGGPKLPLIVLRRSKSKPAMQLRDRLRRSVRLSMSVPDQPAVARIEW